MARKKTYGEKIADHIAAVVQARNIEHILHFTLIENLPGILKNGLLSRAILHDVDYDVFASDVDRLDGEDGAISVSISCFYPKMFDAKRYRSGNAPWVILAFDPSLLWTHHCLFYRNGASTNATKYEHGKRYGGFALERLFDDFINDDGPARDRVSRGAWLAIGLANFSRRRSAGHEPCPPRLPFGCMGRDA